MAKQSMIQRERKREKLIVKYAIKRNSIKEELKNVQSFQERLELYKKFEKVPRNSSPSRNRNRCWVTGRSRGFYKDFGLSTTKNKLFNFSLIQSKITEKIWKSMINSFIDYEYRNFKKK